MPGKPHKTSIPEKAFTVKDGKSLNSERERLNPTSIFTVSSTANFFCWPAIAIDSCRDVFPSRATRYDDFSIAGDGLRRTFRHSHSIVNEPSKLLNRKALVAASQTFTVIFTVKVGGTSIGAGLRAVRPEVTFRDLSTSIDSRDHRGHRR